MALPVTILRQVLDEAAFDAALGDFLARKGAHFADFSTMTGEPRFYFDSDHLNRQGVEAFVKAYLSSILTAQR